MFGPRHRTAADCLADKDLALTRFIDDRTIYCHHCRNTWPDPAQAETYRRHSTMEKKTDG